MPDKGDHAVVIVLAAADAAARLELRRLLESAPGLEVVAEAADSESGVEAVVRHTPAALVLDLDRPGDISSLDTIRAVRQASPETRVIVRRDEGRRAVRPPRAPCRRGRLHPR